MVGMHPSFQQAVQPPPSSHSHATMNDIPAGTAINDRYSYVGTAVSDMDVDMDMDADMDTTIAVGDLDDQGLAGSRQTSYYRLKPGLHGRSVEMAYGTPFLLQLGLSKSLMSLVWLAGPLSGLVMQPVVGVLSDRCTSKLGRRRPFLVVGVAAVVISFLCLGWCKEIMITVFGAGYANLDGVTILMAVSSIYVLDFAINCVQASCRTLIVDSLPSSQQEEAASWASRLMGIGGIFGYFMGNVNLPQQFPVFGNTQIKGLCVVACLFLVLTVGLTCLAVKERVMVLSPRSSTSSFIGEFLQGFKLVFRAIRHLPTRIQHLCNVQFFAWMGWFPFLFYSSTYIAEIYTQERTRIGAPVDPDNGIVDHDQATTVAGVEDAAVRAGSYCLLIYSIVSLISSIVLPAFVAPAEQTSSRPTPGPFSYSRATDGSDNIGGLKRQSSPRWWCWRRQRRFRLPSWLRLPIRGLTLPRMFTLSLTVISFSLVSTWYIQDLRGSTILFACCGIAWAVSMWAPFSILGEVISQQMQEEEHQERLLGTSDGLTVHGEPAEVLYQKGEDEEVEDVDEIEDIPMAETSLGRFYRQKKQYQPVRVRESLDDSVVITPSTNATTEPRNFTTGSSRPGLVSSSTGSFRSRAATPSPSTTTVDGQSVFSTVPGGASTWSASRKTKEMMHVDTDSDPEPDYTSGSSNIADRGSDEDPLGKERQQQEDRRSVLNTPRAMTPQISSSSVSPSSEPSSAGALLGIHNMYVVVPQFLVSFLSSLVFAAIESKVEGDGQVEQGTGNPETIGVMLRFGGVMAGIAALLSLKLWTQPKSVGVSPAHHL
ncbi:hypothetical protein BGX28_009659 [Mortierella sp. GBA30]|nr:hypothetical protein BGX28_009659 [Mortierella sp. GBA30]